MTLIAWGLLDRMLRTASSDKPSEVLAGLHRGVRSLLGQNEAAARVEAAVAADLASRGPHNPGTTGEIGERLAKSAAS